MATGNVVLDTSQYVMISPGAQYMILQSHRDTVRVAVSETQPGLANTAFHDVGGDEDFLVIPFTEYPVWALAMTDASKLSISTKFAAMRKYPSLPTPRVLTTALTQSEIATVEGDRYHSQRVFANVDSGTPVYVAFENPVDSGVLVALQKRTLKSYSSGLISFTIMWDYNISTAARTAMPVYNENNIYRGIKDAQMTVDVLNPLSASPPMGDWVIGDAATIIDEGIERERDFIATSGIGNNTSGDVSPELGFRFYDEGTGFVAKIVTDNNDNRVILGYDWIEVPRSIA